MKGKITYRAFVLLFKKHRDAEDRLLRSVGQLYILGTWVLTYRFQQKYNQSRSSLCLIGLVV